MQRTTPYIVSFDQPMYSIDENSGPVMVTLNLDDQPLTDITVVVFTADGSATGKDTNVAETSSTNSSAIAHIKIK